MNPFAAEEFGLQNGRQPATAAGGLAHLEIATFRGGEGRFPAKQAQVSFLDKDFCPEDNSFISEETSRFLPGKIFILAGKMPFLAGKVIYCLANALPGDVSVSAFLHRIVGMLVVAAFHCVMCGGGVDAGGWQNGS